jgi:invasion protein IalB
MMRSVIQRAGLAVVVGLATVTCAAAQQRSLGSFGTWSAMVDGSGGKKLCYVGSAPKKSEGNYTSRDDVHLLVTHRPAEKVRGEISITAGYTFREGKDAEAQIDGKTFKLFTRGDNAWAYDAAADRAIVAAMKAGKTLIVRGTSSRGTATTDTYTLAGFSAAMAAIDKACGK